MTAHEKNVVMAVFSTLLEMGYSELNTFMGSITIKEMSDLYHRLKYEDYCQKHGLTYEEMTENDFCQAFEEECDAKEAMSYEEYDEYGYDPFIGSYSDEL